MAKAVCCDRCGKFEKVGRDTLFSLGWRILQSEGPSVSDPIGSAPEILLCPDCAKLFKLFMQQK